MGEFNQADNPTKGQKEKALRFLKGKKVARLNAAVYEVAGDTGNHIVLIFEDENRPHVCSCQRTDTCSHIMAAFTFENYAVNFLALADGEDKVKRVKGPDLSR